MNRKINFRAWCETDMATTGIKKFMENKIEEIQLESTENAPQGEFIGEKGIWCGMHEAVLMQYIGKQDINKKEIYEGDIVRNFLCIDDHGEKLYEQGVVKYDEENLGFYVFDSENNMLNISYMRNIEVIGNIFENPGLLNA